MLNGLNIEQSPGNIATAIRTNLCQPALDWQYCFLNRGGDSGEKYISASELLKSSEVLASQLREIVPKESAIILSLEHGPDFLIALIACIFAGRVVIPAPVPRFNLHTQRTGHIVSVNKNAVILTQRKYFPFFTSDLCQDSKTVQERLISIDALMTTPPHKISSTLDGYKIAPEAPVIIQYTSGSTNAPKGVLISSKNIVDNQYQVAKRWKFQKGKTLLTWLPYYHDMGLFGGLLYPLLSSMKIVQIDPLHFVQQPARWLKAMHRFKAHFSGGPAFAFELCNEIESSKIPDDFDFSNWEVAFCGADYVPVQTLQKFRQKFSHLKLNPSAVTPVYGLAEATLYVAGQPNPASLETQVCPGNFTEGCYLGDPIKTDIFIGDAARNIPLAEGMTGEICVHNQSVSNGFLNPKNTTYHNDILRTGDLGYIQNNHLFICGRIKDIVIVNGQNISPSNIEQLAASTSTWLSPHAAAAFQSATPGQGVILLVEAKKSAAGSFPSTKRLYSDITALLQQKLGITPATIKFLKRGELMRTSSGKVQRSLVAHFFEQGYQFKEVISDDS